MSEQLGGVSNRLVTIKDTGRDLLRWSTNLRGPTDEEMIVLQIRGYDLVLPIRDRKLIDVVSENPEHFFTDQMDYLNAHPEIRFERSPEMTVAFQTQEPFLPDTFGRWIIPQAESLDRENSTIQAVLPHARVVMLPTSGYAQADLEYYKQTGKKLFPEGFVVRTGDYNSHFFPGGRDGRIIHGVAHIGRPGRSTLLDIGAHNDARTGYSDVGIMPCIVFV